MSQGVNDVLRDDIPLFWMIDTGSLSLLYLALGLITIGLGLTYGPQAAW